MGILLSGGIDSGAIAAAVRVCDPNHPVHAFTVALRGSDSPDMAAAAELATRFGFIHHKLFFSTADAFRSLSSVISHVET